MGSLPSDRQDVPPVPVERPAPTGRRPEECETAKKGICRQYRGDDDVEVFYTGKYSQLVLMNLKPGEEIDEEVHDDVDQFFRFEEGEGAGIIDGARQTVKDGSGVVVPSGARHNVVNISKTAELKLSAIYSPPEHQGGIVRKTETDADEQEEHYDGTPTE